MYELSYGRALFNYLSYGSLQFFNSFDRSIEDSYASLFTELTTPFTWLSEAVFPTSEEPYNKYIRFLICSLSRISCLVEYHFLTMEREF